VRILLDTNVIIAAFISRGVCHQLLEHCITHHELVTSEFVLDEVREKLVQKFKYPPEVAAEVAMLLRSRMEVVTPAPLAEQVCRDADDDNILAAAVAGNCGCVVTGDKALLTLSQFQGVDIFSPADFQMRESSG